MPKIDEECSYRNFKIPKKSKGFRNICAPNKPLLKKQRQLNKSLVQIFNEAPKQLTQHFHGFLKARSATSGASQHIGKEHIIMLDITNFFDSIKPRMFKQSFIQENANYLFSDREIAAQGFASSPMLGNIALLSFVREIKTYLQPTDTLVIYADDISIGYNGKRPGLENLAIALLTKDGFKLNKKKTRIKQSKFGYMRVLGVNVGKDHIRATRKTMRKIRAAKHQNNGSSLGGLTTWSKCTLPKSRD